MFILPTFIHMLTLSQTQIVYQGYNIINQDGNIYNETLEESIILGDNNIGFGIWMKYQPFWSLQMNQLNQDTFNNRIFQKEENSIINSGGYHIYSLNNLIRNQCIILFSVEMDIITQKISHKIKYAQQQDIEFEFKKLNYEGNWFMFYVYFNFFNKSTKFIISNLNVELYYQEIIVSHIPILDKLIQHKLGGITYLKNSQNKIYYNQFKGRVDKLFTSYYDINKFDVEYYFQWEFQCWYSNELQILDLTQSFHGMNQLYYQTFLLDKPSYAFFGWIKLEYLNRIYRETTLIRISIRNDFTDDQIIGDRAFYLKYYQGDSQDFNGFEIMTYSYDFPIINLYTTKQDDIIQVLGQEYYTLITQWHYIQYEEGTQENNEQPIYKIYFPGQQIQSYTWQKQIYHFTGVQLSINIGGDKFSSNNFLGNINNLQFYTYCQTPKLEMNPKCHHSCQECDGPTLNDCLSCLENGFRIYILSQKQCICQQNYVDINQQKSCQQILESFPQVQIIETQLNCNKIGYDICSEIEIQCSFGYFQYQNSCIKCPGYEFISQVQILCIECILNPLQFYQILQCNNDFVTYNLNNQNSYQIQQRQKYNQEFYKIIQNIDGDYQIILLEGFLNNFQCKQGYFYKNNECLQCIDGCNVCYQQDFCIQCQQQYILTEEKLCTKITECDQYQLLFNKVYCLTCPQKYFIQNDQCKQCGQFCAECDKNGYCNYCIDSSMYFLTFDGQNCQICKINNCLYCYQQFIYNNIVYTTLDINFYTIDLQDIPINTSCALCEQNYYFDFDLNKCIKKCTWISNIEQMNNCLIKQNDCQQGIIINSNVNCLISQQSNIGIQNNDCKQIPYCEQCIHQYNNNQSFCIRCNEGYYSSILLGQCQICPLGCPFCVQQNIKQKDNWKWNIKAFYKLILNSDNQHSFEIYGTETNRQSFEIICTQCYEGYILSYNLCIQGCMPGCQKCGFSNNEVVCQQCKQTQYGNLKSFTQQNNCIDCPSNCAACIDRSQNEIEMINSQYIITALNTKYTRKCFEKYDNMNQNTNTFINQRFQIVTECRYSLKCRNIIKLKYNVYCSMFDYQQLFMDENMKKLRYMNLLIYELFSSVDIQNHESQIFYNYLNDLAIEDIYIQYNMIQGNENNCLLYNRLNIVTYLRQNVFTLQSVNIEFLAQELTTINIQNILNFNNFHRIKFTNIQLQFYSYFNNNYFFNFINSDSKIILDFENSIITSLNQSISLQFKSNIPYSININNLTLNELILQNQCILFNIKLTSINQKQLFQINNFIITNSIFQNSELFILNNDQLQNSLIIRNIQINNTKFENSTFLNSLQIQQQGEVILDNIIINQVEIKNSIFYYQLDICKFYIQNMNFKNSILENSKYILSANFIIYDCNFNNLIMQNSSLIKNYYQVQLFSYINKLKLFLNITKIIFLNILYSQYESLISIQNTNLIQNEQILISNLTIQNTTQIDNKTIDNNIIFIIQTQILIECYICSLNNIQLIRSSGLPEISIINSKNLTITNILITLQKEYYQKTLFENDIYQINYNYKYALFIGYYMNVLIDNLSIQNCIIYNQPLIIFQGQELLQQRNLEQIKIMNSFIDNNILIINQDNSQTAIFLFTTEQLSNLIIQNVIFSFNSLNIYYQDYNKISTSTMTIEVYQGNVSLQNCSFYQNIILNSSNSILNIQCQNLQILNSTFTLNNIFNSTILCDKLDLNLHTQQLKKLKQIFPIKSDGGIGKLIISSLLIDKVIVNISKGLLVGGFYLILQGISSIQILNSQFFYIQNLDNESGLGGCFYIDSSTASLTIIVNNNKFVNSISQTKGGVFFIKPSQSYNLLQFQNLFVDNCFSLQGSFLWISLNDSQNSQVSISIINIIINSTQEGLNSFLKQNIFLNQNRLSLVQSQNSIIQILNGQEIILQNITFTQVYNQILIQISCTQTLIMSNIVVIQGLIYQTPLFYIELALYNIVKLTINDVIISSINKIIFDNFQHSCIFVSGIPNFSKNYNICYNPPSNFEIINDMDELYANNKINCFIQEIFMIDTEITNLIQIKGFNINHQILISNLKLKNINCQDCQLGLFYIENNYSFFTDQNLLINNILIQNSICGFLGCLSIINNYNPLDLTDLKQRNLQQQESHFNQILHQTIIQNSIFLNNTSQYGGSLFIINIALIIKQCKFINNIAKIGGGIYFYSNEYQIQLYDTYFIQNIAEIGGGLYLYNQSLQNWTLLGINFKDNNSTFSSNNVHENPRSITISLDGGLTLLNKKLILKTETKIIEKIVIEPYTTFGLQDKQQYILLPSGTQINKYYYFNQKKQYLIPFNISLRIIALNSLGEQVKYLQDSFCIIDIQVYNTISQQIINNNYSCNISKNNITFDSINGDYNLDDLIINFNPSYPKELITQFFIKCNSIQIPIYDNNWPYSIQQIINDYQLLLEIKTFPCQIGEFINITSGACIRCDTLDNQYQVKQNATSCIFKDDQKINSISYSMIELRQSYWRAYYDSTVIELCYHYQTNCEGGWQPGDISCRIGHIGALCEQCDLYNIRQSENYFKSGLYNCSNCKNTIENLLTVIIISFWTLISIFLSVSSSVEMIDQFIINYRMRMLKIYNFNYENSTAILIKAFTNYLQIISTIASFQLELPEGLSTFTNSIGNPIQSISFSFDCFLITISNIEIIYFRIIWSLIMTLFYQGFFLSLVIILFAMKIIKFKISYITVSIIYLFIYLQPNLVGSLISLFSFRLISEIKWIQGNVAYKYDTQQHKTWIFIFCLPLLLLFSIIIPIFLWYYVFKNKNNLQQPKVRQYWGYLYNEYKQTAYFWETIKIFQKQIIIFVLAYYDDHIPIKASLVFLVLFGYSFYSTTIKPYRTKQLNTIDTQITVVCAISIILGSSIYTAQQSKIQEIVWPFYIVIGLLNGILILKMFIKIIFAYFNKLNKFLDQFKEVLFQLMPQFISNHPILYKILKDNQKQKQLNKQKFQRIRNLLLPKIKKILKYKQFIMNLSKQQSIEQSHKMLINQLQNKESNEQLITNRYAQSSHLSLIKYSQNLFNQQDSIIQEKFNNSVSQQ